MPEPSGQLTRAIAVSPDRGILATADIFTPFVLLYSIARGSKLDNPATLPTAAAYGVAFSPDGGLLAVGHANSPFLTVYNTSTWAKLDNPATLPAGTAYGVAFSPDGSKLVVTVSNRLIAYAVPSLVKLELPNALGQTTIGSFCWHTFPRDMPPPPDPPASPAYYLVSSASGTIGIEGKYYENGTANGRPKYEQENDGPGMLLYAMDMMSEGLVWQVFDANNGFAYENWNIQPATPYIGTYYSQMDAAEITVSYVPGS